MVSVPKGEIPLDLSFQVFIVAVDQMKSFGFLHPMVFKMFLLFRGTDSLSIQGD
jgi:hypothetical protein